MEIKINLLEVASELAELRMYEPFKKAGYTFDQYVSRVNVEDNDVLSFKEEYQDEFNMWYDHYYNEILKYKINE
jgi:hypothetical protein